MLTNHGQAAAEPEADHLPPYPALPGRWIVVCCGGRRTSTCLVTSGFFPLGAPARELGTWAGRGDRAMRAPAESLAT